MKINGRLTGNTKQNYYHFPNVFCITFKSFIASLSNMSNKVMFFMVHLKKKLFGVTQCTLMIHRITPFNYNL